MLPRDADVVGVSAGFAAESRNPGAFGPGFPMSSLLR
jgi:hypothetical protein